MPALAVAASAAGAGEHLHLGQKIALKFSGTGLPQWAVLMLISMVPAVELRGGVPVGNWMGLSPLATLVICVIGNMVPIAPTLLGLRSNFVKKLAAPLLARAEKKLAGLPTGQSRTLALALFVGVPAPGTGAWTGAIIAYLLDMPFGEAMGAIFAGVVLAGLIMTVLTLAGKTGALIALGALLLAGAGAITTALKRERAARPTPAKNPPREPRAHSGQAEPAARLLHLPAARLLHLRCVGTESAGGDAEAAHRLLRRRVRGAARVAHEHRALLRRDADALARVGRPRSE